MPLLGECVGGRKVRERVLDVILLGLEDVSGFQLLEVGLEFVHTIVQIGFSGPPSVTVP